jgi:hypothetical protein
MRAIRGTTQPSAVSPKPNTRGRPASGGPAVSRWAPSRGRACGRPAAPGEPRHAVAHKPGAGLRHPFRRERRRQGEGRQLQGICHSFSPFVEHAPMHRGPERSRHAPRGVTLRGLSVMRDAAAARGGPWRGTVHRTAAAASRHAASAPHPAPDPASHPHPPYSRTGSPGRSRPARTGCRRPA